MISGIVDVGPVARTLCCKTAKTLAALQVFSGADNLAKLNRIGKAT